MKRRACALVLTAALLGGCAARDGTGPRKYQATFLTLFDTVTTIVGYARSQAEFQDRARAIHDQLLVYHRLFDIYHDYHGLNNLKTVNDNAGIAPVEVDERIIALLLDCRRFYEQSDGRVNVAMGSVLELWHQARQDAVEGLGRPELPTADALWEASRHTGFDTVLIDRQAGTVYLSDPTQRLDVGAVAKGWAVERVCCEAPEGLLVSVGGNVRATGPRPTDGSAWVVGVRDPDAGEEDYLHTLSITAGSVVSSGDYQRYFTVDGRRYHHIIDPDTMYPAAYWRSVTVLCADSGLGDALSTALFNLPLEEGKALAAACGAQAMWLDKDRQARYTPGFQDYIRT